VKDFVLILFSFFLKKFVHTIFFSQQIFCAQIRVCEQTYMKHYYIKFMRVNFSYKFCLYTFVS
jgi:hypothetical protein